MNKIFPKIEISENHSAEVQQALEKFNAALTAWNDANTPAPVPVNPLRRFAHWANETDARLIKVSMIAGVLSVTLGTIAMLVFDWLMLYAAQILEVAR